MKLSEVENERRVKAMEEKQERMAAEYEAMVDTYKAKVAEMQVAMGLSKEEIEASLLRGHVRDGTSGKAPDLATMRRKERWDEQVQEKEQAGLKPWEPWSEGYKTAAAFRAVRKFSHPFGLKRGASTQNAAGEAAYADGYAAGRAAAAAAAAAAAHQAPWPPRRRRRRGRSRRWEAQAAAAAAASARTASVRWSRRAAPTTSRAARPPRRPPPRRAAAAAAAAQALSSALQCRRCTSARAASMPSLSARSAPRPSPRPRGPLPAGGWRDAAPRAADADGARELARFGVADVADAAGGLAWCGGRRRRMMMVRHRRRHRVLRVVRDGEVPHTRCGVTPHSLCMCMAPAVCVSVACFSPSKISMLLRLVPPRRRANRPAVPHLWRGRL